MVIGQKTIRAYGLAAVSLFCETRIAKLLVKNPTIYNMAGAAKI